MEREELARLIEDTDKFIAAIFDNVAPLACAGFLHQVYDFREVVAKKLERIP